MDTNNNNSYTYNYSAKQQNEVRKIYEKYVTKDEDKMAKLIRLDKYANLWGNLVTITLGTIGVLIFGIGMCFGLVWNDSVLGIALAVVGACIAAPAYFVGKIITTKMRNKVTPEILALCDELMK